MAEANTMRPGTRNLGVVPAGSKIFRYDHRVIVVPPEGPPFSIDALTGKRETLEVRDGKPVVTTVTIDQVTFSVGTAA